MMIVVFCVNQLQLIVLHYKATAILASCSAHCKAFFAKKTTKTECVAQKQQP
jgi:hypothetical protein